MRRPELFDWSIAICFCFFAFFKLFPIVRITKVLVFGFSLLCNVLLLLLLFQLVCCSDLTPLSM